MPAPKIELSDIERGISRYEAGERPWRQTLNRVDWFILYNSKLYPLKYTYALAANVPPVEFTTDQMKSAMRNLQLSFISLKGQPEQSIEFERSIEESTNNPLARKERLRNANVKPEIIFTYSQSFKRNPDVVAEVLERADGKCECCKKAAPFNKAKDNKPYLEIHHKIFLANDGEDSVENSEALCPNCHRQKHYG
ncbi:HNH endonuclease [Alcanivorax sp. VBW004]|uniref:HNH endonuclease n=1 Tax=Alcanivorax sp. VBW004 TaxID=1287708 RepID=UPI0012BC9A6B|nr:HNH endonuclease signature motif containing protein [Alcanivorax sp. VBW004]MTT53236.1 HNH endonuclease [Alcanivorax sp. VBW004]